ncbi:DUF4129 domain-containing protein [Neorhodopirellula pilleata]|uniref:Protein-glutamine gamma-glutamyltransferase-like C-terminal domain-containing protein n=1 Tax=Neorhodopirellula pilleata TaxID=2714738 RepID=A0A5C6AV37_9BACT|nr:DUF4129 domain-containing protein [Neorhodopirellula pilleata]TWU01984.1 hypothetical protein Pla100_17200 [Neorhodopirellula pilleata]
MQLDQTNVAIRVRTLSEIGDLSLMMVRRYPRAFVREFILGAVFWMIVNTILLGWMTLDFSSNETFEGETDALFWRYLIWMATLVFLQTPIAGVLSTYSLGQSIFESQPPLRRTLRECRKMFWPLVWTLGVKRMAIPAVAIVAFRWGQESSGFYDVALPITLVLVASVVRSNRPFLAEMILLERCPIKSPSPNVITLARRSKALHTPLSSELGGRFLSVALVLSALLGCVFYSIFWVRGITLSDWTVDTVAMLVFYPLALWVIASLSVVVRLLGYLDARIRLEGWEVELAIRAEAIRQFGEDIMSIPTPAEIVDSPVTGNSSGATASRVGAGTAILLFALISCVNSHGFAQDVSLDSASETRFDPVVADSAWFDSESKTIVPIEVVDRRTDTLNRESRWTPKPPQSKAKTAQKNTPPPATTGPTTFWGALTWGNLFGWFLLFLLMSALIAALAYVFANSSFDFRPAPIQQTLVRQESLDDQTKRRIAELPAELRDTDVHPRTELERLMQQGDYDRAIIFLYGHQLLMLDRAAWLRLSRWKTNHQYVREARGNRLPAGDLLAETVQAFERSYFGRHSLNGEQFNLLWQNNLQLESMIAPPAVAKA